MVQAVFASASTSFAEIERDGDEGFSHLPGEVWITGAQTPKGVSEGPDGD